MRFTGQHPIVPITFRGMNQNDKTSSENFKLFFWQGYGLVLHGKNMAVCLMMNLVNNIIMMIGLNH